MENTYSRSCPVCNNNIIYHSQKKFYIENKFNRECDKCVMTRNCPCCKEAIIYKSIISKRRADKKNEFCNSCYKKSEEYLNILQTRKAKKKAAQIASWTPERKKERSEKYSGEGNPFYGKTFSDDTIEKFRNKDFSYMKTVEFSEATRQGMKNSKNWNNWLLNIKSLKTLWIEKLGEEKALERWEDWKSKMSFSMSGEKNPMYGKPAPFKAGNGIQGWYNEHYFRSLRELSFMLKLDSMNIKWVSGESHEFKIEYELDGVKRNYFPDFIVDDKIIVECKPLYLIETKQIKTKTFYAEKFCKERNMEYTIFDPEKISIVDLKILKEYQQESNITD